MLVFIYMPKSPYPIQWMASCICDQTRCLSFVQTFLKSMFILLTRHIQSELKGLAGLPWGMLSSLNLSPSINSCHGVSHTRWGINVCAVHQKGIRSKDPSANNGWWREKIPWCLLGRSRWVIACSLNDITNYCHLQSNVRPWQAVHERLGQKTLIGQPHKKVRRIGAVKKVAAVVNSILAKVAASGHLDERDK